MITPTATVRLVTDHLGSVTAVVNVITGARWCGLCLPTGSGSRVEAGSEPGRAPPVLTGPHPELPTVPRDVNHKPWIMRAPDHPSFTRGRRCPRSFAAPAAGRRSERSELRSTGERSENGRRPEAVMAQRRGSYHAPPHTPIERRTSPHAPATPISHSKTTSTNPSQPGTARRPPAVSAAQTGVAWIWRRVSCERQGGSRRRHSPSRMTARW